MHWLMYLLRSWVVNAIVLLVVTIVLDGVTDDSAGSLLAAAAVFGILNTVVKPVLRLFTLPLAVITLGLIKFPIAMAMLAITDWLVTGFDIDGFRTLVVATIAVWLVDLCLEAVEGFMRKRRGEGATAAQ